MFLHKPDRLAALEERNLDHAHLRLQLLSHHGIPRTSSRLAFDPVQRLLAIGTLDGRIKLFGNNGVEGILISDSTSRCKFLEFANNQGLLVNVTAENDLQIWDLEKMELGQTHRWHTNVTAFSVIQGSPFIYIGEDSGDVAVLEYDKEQRKLRQMPYQISVQVTRGAVGGLDNSSASVIGILPFAEAVHRRVLIAYNDGIVVVWSVADSLVKEIRIVSGKKIDQAVHFNDVDFEDEKDICSMCLVGPSGELLAIGYTDGDIWLWNIDKSSSQPDVPFMKVQLSADDARSPVLAMRWCATGGREAAGPLTGHLFIYGGRGFENSEAFTVCSLKTARDAMDVPNVHCMDIPLEGLLEDMILLSGPGSTFSDQASALLVLTSQGQLHAYDQAAILQSLERNAETSASTLTNPILINSFTSGITVVKLAELSEDSKAHEILHQLPRHLRGNLPSVLPAGTKWPVTGGGLSRGSERGSKILAMLVTGHTDGSVTVWDATSSVFFELCNLSPTLQGGTAASVVSHIEFCPCRGILVVAQENTMVYIYKVNAESGEAVCKLYTSSDVRDLQIHQRAGFQCVAIIDRDVEPTSISISKEHEHVAVGHADGTVLIFDIDNFAQRIHRISPPNEQKQIQYLAFGLGFGISAAVDSQPSAAKSLKRVLYAATDSSFSALVYSSEDASVNGEWKSDDSRILYMCCLEIPKKQENHGKASTLADHLAAGSTNDNKCSEQTYSCSHYLTICSQATACIYTCSVSNEVANLKIFKNAHFPTPCISASTFSRRNGDTHKLLLLNKSAFIEIRSFPDLEVVQQLYLVGIYNLDPKVSENPILLCSEKGVMGLVDLKREIVLFSILSADENSRIDDRTVSFFDKDLAAASEAALKAGSHQPRRKSQLQGLIGGVLKELKVGGVLKEIKGGLLKSPKGGKDESTGVQESDPLAKVFMSPLSFDGNVTAQVQAEKTNNIEIGDSGPELDIDDIEIEDEEISQPGYIGKTPSLKGKNKFFDPSDDRKDLLGGDEDYSKPIRRSPDEIRAKYGHKPLGDVSGSAAQARDKLLERHERLQALGKRTEEMQEGAQNFASMAAELAKTMEAKKWWQL
ncbi:hypothetical protein KP509_24G067200 [Ceratopteris richardii]|uniref:V-SNARE coiled-coil homology domain-containing protein n=1 Tax=Ceratopteris richardii TaxID=49495 RepID=A0A8T2RVF2_CERRI|nr:hypothetical protein KP509_24G067200 [Ceratopteris richardii]KAH7300546.1 hypothetical protein KP509_24G067200 [Ceratopteris richardii]KAH7300547.1 hypothetical protein KP509_24G067200 [Ceratopteris richardii]